MNSSSYTLSAAVTCAVAFLTSNLVTVYPVMNVLKLQLLLEASLITTYTPSWVESQPTRGSGRRCITLSPRCLPPRAVYAACIASGVSWFDWISVLGGREFDLFVDPGRVAIRLTAGKKTVLVWSAEEELRAFQEQLKAQEEARLLKTLCDEDNEDLFTLIADEVSSRPSSSLSNFSAASSSCSSGGASFSSISDAGSERAMTPLRRQRGVRQARPFVDVTKVDVTSYDSGKVGVLTGGVMLGGGHKKSAAAPSPAARPSVAGRWRL